jgi:DNA repair exonuclease SbcCD ATPase subunit
VFRRKARKAHFEPAKDAAPELAAGDSVGEPDAVVEPEAVVVATPEPQSCEYRHIGDEHALLTVLVRVGDAPAPTEATLLIDAGGAVREAPSAAASFHPSIGSARLIFVVPRDVSGYRDASLELAFGSAGRAELPAPAQHAALIAPQRDVDEVVGAALTGEQLLGVIELLEKRCVTAERAVGDMRARNSESRKLAQAWRESSDLRAMLDSRESAYRTHRDAIDAAQRARDEYQAAAETLQAELERRQAELAETTRRQTQLEGAVFELEERLGERGHLVTRLEQEIAELQNDLAATTELAEASEAVRVEQADELAATSHALEELQTVSADRLEDLEAEIAERGEAITRLHDELDRRTTAIAQIEQQLAERSETIDRLRGDTDEIRGDRDRLRAVLSRLQEDLATSIELAQSAEADREQAQVAAARLREELETTREDAKATMAVCGELATARDEAQTTAARLGKEIEASQAAAADAQGMLERERALYEGRINVSAEAERQVRGEIRALRAELDNLRVGRDGGAPAPQPSATEPSALAERTRTRQLTIEEQRAQVAELERQLEQIKQRAAQRQGVHAVGA